MAWFAVLYGHSQIGLLRMFAGVAGNHFERLSQCYCLPSCGKYLNAENPLWTKCPLQHGGLDLYFQWRSRDLVR